MARWYRGWKLLTTRLRSLYTIHFSVPFMEMTEFDYKLMEGNLDDHWSTWLIFADKLSPCQGNLFQLIVFLRQAVSLSGELVPLDWFSQTSCFLIRGTCSTWVILPDTLSPHGEIKDIFNWFLVLISCRFERLKKWLTALFMVFPYMVRGNNQLFVTI